MRARLVFIALLIALSADLLSLWPAPAAPAKGPTYPLVRIDYRGADLVYVLRELATAMHMNLVADRTVAGTVNADLRNVRADRAFRLIATIHGLTYQTMYGNTIVVSGSP